MLCCNRCLSCLKIKMPRTRKSSLTMVKRQLSSGSTAKVKFLVRSSFYHVHCHIIMIRWTLKPSSKSVYRYIICGIFICLSKLSCKRCKDFEVKLFQCNNFTFNCCRLWDCVIMICQPQDTV